MKPTSVSDRPLWILVAIHLLLTPAAAVAMVFVPPRVDCLPLLWALSSIPLAQCFLLSLWCGLGSASIRYRAGGLLLFPLYCAASQSYSYLYRGPPNWGVFAITLLTHWGVLLLLTSVSVGVLLVIRRWFAEVRRLPDPSHAAGGSRWQFTILNLLLITSATAVVLALVRAARLTGDQSMENWWTGVVLFGLFFIVFFLNTICAAWATLRAGPIGWPLLAVAAVSILLGIALAVAGQWKEDILTPALVFRLRAGMLLAAVVPLVIIVPSLLVVRVRGYRFCRRRTEAGRSS